MTPIVSTKQLHTTGGVFGATPKELDQFFTTLRVAEQCVDTLQSYLNQPLAKTFESILEPSFGDGAFVEALQNRCEFESPEQLRFLDIDAALPEHCGD